MAESHKLCNRKLGEPHQFRQSNLRSKSTTVSANQGTKGHPSKGSKGYERGERQSGDRSKA